MMFKMFSLLFGAVAKAQMLVNAGEGCASTSNAQAITSFQDLSGVNWVAVSNANSTNIYEWDKSKEELFFWQSLPTLGGTRVIGFQQAGQQYLTASGKYDSPRIYAVNGNNAFWARFVFPIPAGVSDMVYYETLTDGPSIAIAGTLGSSTYAFDGETYKQKENWDDTPLASDWEVFTMDGQQFIGVLCNGAEIRVYDMTTFSLLQSIPLDPSRLAVRTHHFVAPAVDGSSTHFLAMSDGSDQTSLLWFWNGTAFDMHQHDLPTQYTYAMKSVWVGSQLYLVAAQGKPNNGTVGITVSNEVSSVLLWDPTLQNTNPSTTGRFVEVQVVPTFGARDVAILDDGTGTKRVIFANEGLGLNQAAASIVYQFSTTCTDSTCTNINDITCNVGTKAGLNWWQILLIAVGSAAILASCLSVVFCYRKRIAAYFRPDSRWLKQEDEFGAKEGSGSTTAPPTPVPTIVGQQNAPLRAAPSADGV